VVDAARFDPTGIATTHCGRWMPQTIEGLAIDNDYQVRQAAGRQAHLAPTIRAGGHGVDTN